MEIAQKTLTRIQLVNWHYFEYERIALGGSTLLSGENATGKSTVLDAIQLVLTTNSRKFNVAANEKGNRTLKGYVRCKVGNIGETYYRKGTVPANVALEFYEEKGNRYFVLGVHLLSADEESSVFKKWYAEECRLEDLSFIIDGRAALSEEFRNGTRKIRYMDTDKSARDKFRHRMGNLEEKFFDIIPKSLAFKPMDNVKEFINKFVLSEEKVDVQGLKENIETLDELDKVLEKTKNQLISLDEILVKYTEVQKKEKDIKINDILLKMASKNACMERIDKLEKDIRIKTQTMEQNAEDLQLMDTELSGLNDKIIALSVDIQNNESSKLVENINQKINQIKSGIEENKKKEKGLKEKVLELKNYLKLAIKVEKKILSREETDFLTEAVREEKKREIIERLEEHFRKEYQELLKERGKLAAELDRMNEEISSLRDRQSSLEKRQLSYLQNTVELKKEIEKELERHGISSQVHILSELLEVTDERWRNAVEGYLNTQKFYLVVSPEDYDLALSVYDKKRNRIHTAGIINTKKIPLEYEENHKSLAYVVKSENRYAKAYVNYLLGRVIRCEKVSELEQYRIAITAECMLYQGYVVRHLNPKDYKDPYIGLNAYRVQLANVRKQIEELTGERKQLREKYTNYADVVEMGNRVNLELIKLYLNAPYLLMMAEKELRNAEAELLEAKKDPNLIELNIKLSDTREQRNALQKERDRLNADNQKLKYQTEGAEAGLYEEKR
ncbi:MAG: AAA family ATPase, partial [Lachnospiraceae bacterium]|nr:AAA family ATPase [Lachnospiraceae bacterium]